MERIGVAFTGGLAPTEVVECVVLAEELGYESAWMTEGHGGDQFSILTACALSTKTILLGTAISSVFVRSAPTIAMATASVDHFSQGRFILGLGSSHKVQVEHGLSFSQPVARLREYVEIVRGLLRRGDVTHEGSVFQIKSFDFWFEVYRKEIPIYVAAVFPRMLQISGEIAQGALLTWCTTEHASSAAENVAVGARRAGRDPKEVDIAALLSCAVSDGKEEAINSMRGVLASYTARFPRYRRLMAEAGFAREIEAVREAWKEGDREGAMRRVPAALVEKIALVGSPDDCRHRIEAYRSAGIRLPIISPRVTGKDAEKQVMECILACAPGRGTSA